jgi:hypothetical protein
MPSSISLILFTYISNVIFYKFNSNITYIIDIIFYIFNSNITYISYIIFYICNSIITYISYFTSITFDMSNLFCDVYLIYFVIYRRGALE